MGRSDGTYIRSEFHSKEFFDRQGGLHHSKDLQSSKLEELLVARYGGIADSEEPQQIED